MEKEPTINIFGNPIEICSFSPLTGYFRDGACNTCAQDVGSHTVCAQMTAEFLAFSKYVGNDLTTPNPDFMFPGLKPGDWWCLTAQRFLQAHDEGCAPLVNLNATHVGVLKIIPMEILELYDHKKATT